MEHNACCDLRDRESVGTCCMLAMQNQPATSQQIQQVQRLLSQMCVGNSSFITGESQTALGNSVLNKIQRTVLFRVDDCHRAMSRL